MLSALYATPVSRLSANRVAGVFPIRRNPIRRKNRTPYIFNYIFSPNFLLL